MFSRALSAGKANILRDKAESHGRRRPARHVGATGTDPAAV
jgi:hypothetical protein